MPEFSGLSNSIRFPGSIDNQRLSYSTRVEEHCSPPFIKPTRTCTERPAGADGSGSLQTIMMDVMEETCECEVVADYLEGFDRESCGCQGLSLIHI